MSKVPNTLGAYNTVKHLVVGTEGCYKYRYHTVALALSPSLSEIWYAILL